MSTSTDFMAFGFVLCGRSKSLQGFQSELCDPKGSVNLVSAYASIFGASSYIKESFYDALADNVRLMNIEEPHLILGDFNAGVGN